eukprot:6197149-Pleurochrysis_carterae.AAC.2
MAADLNRLGNRLGGDVRVGGWRGALTRSRGRVRGCGRWRPCAQKCQRRTRRNGTRLRRAWERQDKAMAGCTNSALLHEQEGMGTEKGAHQVSRHGHSQHMLLRSIVA